MDTSLKARMAPCLGLLVIARIVEDAGHDVKIVNGNVETDDPAEPVDLVGVTVTVDVFPAAREIARRYRERGVPVVAGGIFVTSCPEAARGAFDALCIGPAAERSGRHSCPQGKYYQAAALPEPGGY